MQKHWSIRQYFAVLVSISVFECFTPIKNRKEFYYKACISTCIKIRLLPEDVPLTKWVGLLINWTAVVWYWLSDSKPAPLVLSLEQHLNPLSANPKKWWNTLKQFVGKLPTNCLSVLGHFVKFALKGLNTLD